MGLISGDAGNGEIRKRSMLSTRKHEFVYSCIMRKSSNCPADIDL